MLANITPANMFALERHLYFVATLLVQTTVALRVANMVGCIFFETGRAAGQWNFTTMPTARSRANEAAGE
jgi:hypothetical protein